MMTVRAQHNGHDIYLDTKANVWRFKDTGEVVNHERACSRCGLAPVQIRLHHLTPTYKRTTAGVDACLGPLIQALNDGGMQTIASCCGHGAPFGTVILEDHRELLVFPTLVARLEFMDRPVSPDMVVPPGDTPLPLPVIAQPLLPALPGDGERPQVISALIRARTVLDGIGEPWARAAERAINDALSCVRHRASGDGERPSGADAVFPPSARASSVSFDAPTEREPDLSAGDHVPASTTLTPAPGSPRGWHAGALYCYGGCGTRYADFPRDMIVPTPLWNRIAVGSPFDEAQENVEREGRGGVLCPACIIARLAALPDCTVICADIQRPSPAPDGQREALRDVVTAVLHQMQHGEAADFIRGEDSDLDAARRDLRWCRDQVAAAQELEGPAPEVAADQVRSATATAVLRDLLDEIEALPADRRGADGEPNGFAICDLIDTKIALLTGGDQ